MKMAETDKDFKDLDLLFAEARQSEGQMPEGLFRRIVADGEQVQAGFAAAAATHGPARGQAHGQGMWSQIVTVLGGWPALGGLAAACAAGVWIGLAPPSFLPDPAELVLGGNAQMDLIGLDELIAVLAEEG